LAILALVVFACGGDTASEPAPTSTTEADNDGGTEPSATDSSTTQPNANEEPVASGEEGTGTATIDNTTWEFNMSGPAGGTCDLDFNDAGVQLIVIMYGIDDTGREVALNITGPPSGGDASLVQVGSPTLEFERWTADPSVYDRLSGIEGMPEGVGATIQISGNTVSGSGVFFDDTTLTEIRPTGDPYDAGVLEGTFSATCPAG
jgi:hypothetical protein